MSALLLAVDESRVSAGPLGLLVVVLMVVATVFLIRNMNSRLKRLPRDFPEQQRDEPTPPEAGSSPGGR